MLGKYQVVKIQNRKVPTCAGMRLIPCEGGAFTVPPCTGREEVHLYERPNIGVRTQAKRGSSMCHGAHKRLKTFSVNGKEKN